MTVYLIHIEPAFGHARHYVGSTPRERLWRRLCEHADGYGANLTHYARAAGCALILARTWDGLRGEERRIKARPRGSRGMPRSCPVCHPMPRIDRWAGGGVRITKRFDRYQAEHPNCRPIAVKSELEADPWGYAEQVA